VRPERRAEVAVGAIVRRGDELLLVRRAHDPAAGSWSVPGGRVEPGEGLVAAVAREVVEETGLAVEVGGLAGWTEHIDDDHHYVILDFFASPLGSDAPVAAGDATEARWVAPDELGGLVLVPGLREYLERVGAWPRQ
jgi:ADP-ribose pyrophosphatase YjhB (NUDIX family)